MGKDKIKFSSSNFVMSETDISQSALERVKWYEDHDMEYSKVHAVIDGLLDKQNDRNTADFIYPILFIQALFTAGVFVAAKQNIEPFTFSYLAALTGLIGTVPIAKMVDIIKAKAQLKKVEEIAQIEQEKKDKADAEWKELQRRAEERRKQETIPLTDKEKREKAEYIEFLVEHGANQNIILMPAIQRVMDQSIHGNNSYASQQPHPPIRYNQPNIDGTFDIQVTNTEGPDIWWKMEFCNEGNDEKYIKLTRKTRKTVHYLMDDPIGDDYDVDDVTVIYINKEGKESSREENREYVK